MVFKEWCLVLVVLSISLSVQGLNFEQAQYTVARTESTFSIDEVLVTIPVKGVSGNVTYASPNGGLLVDGNTYFRLVINDTLNTVSLVVDSSPAASLLDYELLGNYIFGINNPVARLTIMITATDSADNTNATTTVFLDISNDNECQFSSNLIRLVLMEQSATVSSESPNLYTLRTIVPYAGVTFGLNTTKTSAVASGIFDLNSISGIVSVKDGAVIDYESATEHSLFFNCLVNGVASPAGTGEFEIKVLIGDINDNNNVFAASSYAFSVSEDVSIGYSVGNVSATDADSSTEFKATYYYVAAEQFSSFFIINSTTGIISTSGTLNYEASTSYALTVCATDNATSATQTDPSSNIRANCVPVTITLQDVNDNHPIFKATSPSIQVSEKVPVGRAIYTFVATDEDSGVNGEIEYGSDNINASLFVLNSSTGVVSTVALLNHEDAVSHTITVYAVDKGTPNTRQSLVNSTLTINVADVNDNNPIFPEDIYTFNVTENYAGFLTNIVAVDSDGTSPNKDVTYRVVDPSGSAIITYLADGNITINTGKLDRESSSKHEFLLVATDSSTDTTDQRSDSAILILNVLDQNDNAPVISPEDYNVTIAHYAPFQSSIFDFDATDVDIIGDVTFQASDPSDPDWLYFELNSTTGDILLKDSRADVGVYTVQVYANDGVHNSTKIATLRINVKEDSLMFVSDRYHYELPETTNVAVVGFIGIAGVASKDAPEITPANPNVRYYIRDDTSHQSESKFQIPDPKTTKISLKEALDFEAQRYYAFNVDAVDSTGELRNATTLVVVDVLDRVDVNPKLYVGCDANPNNCTEGTYNLGENAIVGEVVTVLYVDDIDTESVNVGGMTYTLNDTSLPFNIIMGHRQTTAYIVVKDSAIDYESKQQYAFTVQVRDAQDLESNVVSITVNVVDRNDNSPVFEQPDGYTFSIPETTASSSNVGPVKANDADGTSPYNNVTYSIRSSVESQNVLVNAVTGEISINSSIDYEMNKHFDVVVVATDGAIPDSYKREKAVAVRIDITDINDNAPIFSGSSNFSLDEDTAVNSQVFAVAASDADSGDNAKFVFTSAMSSPFAVLPTGEIILKSALDYESQQSYVMKIVANDTGGLFTERNITITVVNVDDNRPIFNQSLGYAQSVSEASLPGDSNILLKVEAIDADLHTYNKVSYSIINPFKNIQASTLFPFKINATSGEIILAYPLDRETRDMYQFIVKATDDGQPEQLTNVVFVNITVTDENDNSPLFNAPCYNVTISDATIVGGTVRVVSANDIDAGLNGEIHYSIEDPTNHFSIDNATGAVYVADHLYFKNRNSYPIKVVASDKGQPSRNGSCSFVISLTAMKNYPTTVAEVDYMENVGGNLPLAPMMILSTSDTPTYELEFINRTESAAHFSINAADGVVSISQILDREVLKEHVFIRKALVNGYVIGEQTVFVDVLDMNDNIPYFAPESINQVVNISESSEVGQIVAVLRAFDLDETDKLSIFITPVPGFNFDVSSANDTYVIFLTAEWDAEVATEATLVATLDDGKNRVSTNIKVNVIDENDNSPLFNQTVYKFNKMEGSADPIVGQVFATDKDATTLRNEIKFRILDVEPQQTFEIYDNGTIVCKQTLDREQVPYYEFTVEAYNTDEAESRVGAAVVHITVDDINDNPPVCHGPTTYLFKENKPLGTLFMINATDEDAGENARLTYILVSPGNLDVVVDPVTGAVQLLTPMDYEKYKSTSITVDIKDNGIAQKFVSKTYIIELEDVNDNAPVFTIRPSLKYIQSIMENVPVGTSVIQTNAFDGDSGVNKELNFTLYDAFNNLPFNISSTGLISISGPIDREQQSFYQFFITVSDNGDPSLSDTILVEVTILDENDNNPIFDRLEYNISLAEGTLKDFSVLQVNAKDADADLFGKVCYGLKNIDNSLFALDTSTGVLSTTDKVGPIPTSYRMIINASDKDTVNMRHSLQDVIVNIQIVRLIGPKFSRNYLEYDILENKESHIANVKAQGDVVAYSIIYDDVSRPYARNFIVDDGNLHIVKGLDYEKVKTLSFTVQARDVYNLNATLNIVINVLDEEDNSPYWLPINKTDNVIDVTITDETRPGQVVETLNAGDADSVSHNRLKFTIVNDIYSAFDILSYRDVGKIVVTKDLRFLPSPLTINVEVEDPKGNKANTSCLLRISVLQPALPKFLPSVYSFDVFEANTTLIGQVSATGVPTSRYRIISNEDQLSPLFTINDNTGVITATRFLDIESQREHTITVEAREKDSSRFAVAVVHVSVKPVNEFAPVFTSPIRYWVSELLPINSNVIQLDASDADYFYKTLTYSFISSDLATLQLSVNPQTGNVTYLGGLNFESKPTVSVTFRATDNGGKFTNHLVQMLLSNVNEHSPVFTSSIYSTSINEDFNGFLNFAVKANDNDAGPSGEVEYRFLTGQNVGPFVIDSVNGSISMNTLLTLDYETKTSYELVVVASDKGQETRSSTAVFVAKVNNVNDNRPIFNPQVYRLTISDNTPVFRSLCNIQATDADISPLNNFTYQITTGSGMEYFDINPETGEIFLKKAIEYQYPDTRSFKLKVIATEEAGLTSPTPADVTIDIVQSLLPEPPYFIRAQYVITFNEDIDLNELLRVKSVNPSGGPVQYSLINNTLIPDEDFFYLDKDAGALFLTKKLDYETQRRHDFEARVTCSTTGMSGVATFTVFVEDVNDNPPQFVAPRSKTIHINEKTNIGQEVTRIFSSDVDTVSNDLFFQIKTPNVPFQISSNGKNAVVSVSQELRPTIYTMEITVFDKHGNGKLANEAAQKYFLTVNVTENDKRYPLFSQAVYSYTLDENTPAPKALFSVSTSNPPNPVYKLLDSRGRFSINQLGQISVNHVFDAEVDPTCDFTVSATNSHNNFTSFAIVTVDIRDLNDNGPIFQGPFIFTYPEDEAKNSLLFTAQVTDADKTVLPKTYTLISSSIPLTVQENNGMVFLDANFNYEARIKHTAVIEVKDGALSARQNYTLHITNVNEFDPVFKKQVYTLELIENQGKVGGFDELMRLQVSDNDAGDAGQVELRIENGENIPFFIPKDNPILYLTGPLDAESKREYRFTAVGEDKGTPRRTGLTSIIVTIKDENDNQPIFDKSIYEVDVVEIAPIGQSLIVVHATDKDIDEVHRIVEYKKIKGSDLFKVDPVTGVVSTDALLDHETLAYHEITIQALDKDKPNPTTASESTVRIRVIDANEHEPSFATPVKTLTILENTAVGRRIGETEAKDSDSSFKTVKYSTEQQENPPVFSITETTGVISLARPVDYELKNSYAFTVVATDNGGLKGRQNVIVNIADTNDNDPKFNDRYNQTFVISKLIRDGQTIAVVHATDKDLVSQGKLVISLVDNTLPFEVVMDGHSGYLSKKAGAELQLGNYNVALRVTDGLRTSEVNAYISIVVKYPQGVIIKFIQETGYAFNVSENAQNHIFGPTQATVTDNLATISYRIVEPNVPFTISTSGLLSQAAPFDYETVQYYLIHVMASVTYDGNTYSTIASVHIKVKDVNDNSPYFEGRNSVNIPEDTLVGTRILTITAKDADAPGTPNSLTVYNLQGSSKFTIDSSTGEITLLQALDYEDPNQRKFELTVTAFDKGQPAKSGKNVYTVNVFNVNDNAPSFVRSVYTVDVNEDSGTDNNLLCVKANDADDLKALKYELYNADDESKRFFGVSPNDGCIFYIGPSQGLDREKRTYYELLIRAYDSGSPELSAFTNVIVNVQDTNDNTPLFASSFYNLQLSEETTLGTEIIQLTATDRDAGTNGEVQLSISSGNIGNAFSLTSNGRLRTATSLLSAPKEFNLVIRAQDKGARPQSSQVNIKIAIIDAKKFISPTWTQSVYSRSISENQATGQSILKVSATYPGALISYEIMDSSIKTNGKIAISANGDISLLQKLDYEDIQSVSFYVKAYDSNKRDEGYSTAIVRITIQDFNDNPPVFSRTNYQTSLARDSKVGTVIANVVATDADSATGNANIVRYEFAPNQLNTDLFSINSVTGDFTLQRIIGKADIKNYEMNVRAYDLATPKLTSTNNVRIAVNVYPDNMFAPVITNANALQSLTISESALFNTQVTTVRATDEDSELSAAARAERPSASNFGAVSFQILQSGIPFILDASTGVLRVSGTLDRETKSEYDFTIQARDGGNPSRVTTALARVTLTDINEAPKFQQSSYVTKISECSPLDMSVLSVNAVDEDSSSNSRVQYSGNLGPKFKLDASTGEISLIDHLDFENQSRYTFTVQATDGRFNANPAASIVIDVIDCKDEVSTEGIPVFDKSIYYFSKDESSTGQSLGNVRATGATVTYSLVANGNDNLFFTVNAASGLVTLSAVDYESQRTYSAVVKATNTENTALSSITSIVVTVQDINDNTPAFVGGTTVSASIKENEPIDSVVYTSYATDNDSGNNGKLTFSLVEESTLFKIETLDNTGIVKVKSNINYDGQPSSYSLRIRVSDNAGAQPRSAEQTLTVNILDVNDNNPQPIDGKSSGSTTIPQSFGIGNKVPFTVQYSDLDSSDNGKIQYILAQQSEYFKLDLDNGTIFSKKALEPGSYKLYITPEDMGTPKRQSAFTLTINVESDGPENTPYFNPDVYSFSVSEASLINSIIGHLNVIDGDFFTDSYTYTIQGNSNPPFNVLSNGNVQVKRNLDRESSSSYSLKVKVQDRAGNSPQKEASVTITVIDENDNNPIFNPASYVFNVPENQQVGNVNNGPFIGTEITATDGDEQDTANSQITYSLVDSTDTFKMSGQKIYLNKQLNFDAKKEFNIFVIAQDQGNPRRHNTASVTVKVIDINERPVFQPSFYTIDVVESAIIDSKLLTLNVIDNDEGDNALVDLTIAPANEKFRLSGNDLFLNGALNFEVTKSYTLNIKASDTGSPSLQALTSATVIVNVKGINDNEPQFLQNPYTGKVDENLVNQVLVTARATDADQNSLIYTLDNSEDAKSFSTQLSNGNILILNSAPLDYEKQKQYKFDLVASDGTFTGKTTIIIDVNDQNDHRPVFSPTTYKFIVADSAPTGIIIGCVQSTDSDTGIFAETSYTFSAGETTPFLLQDNCIVLKDTLDYTKKTSYLFQVAALEKQNSLTAEEAASVTVDVKPSNGSAPVFDKSVYAVTVFDNVTNADTIVIVKATDDDGTGYNTITYSLDTSLGDARYFKIGSTSGRVQLADGQTLSIRNNIRHALVVNAVDNKGLMSQAYVIVDVKGVTIDPTKPTFEVTDYFGVATDRMAASTSIVRVYADGPSGIKYKLESGNDDDLFAVSDFGTVLLKSPIVYDASRPTSYTLFISGTSSSGVKSTKNAKVFVQLHYLSADSPAFTRSEYTANIDEGEDGKPVTLVSASFGNNGTVGSIRYKILYNDVVRIDDFTINEVSGQISSERKFDREVRSQYIFEVETYNSAQLTSNDKALVTINIDDSNDNAPVFKQTGTVTVDIPENGPAGMQVACVFATDADEGVNAQFKYSLLDNFTMFAIDQDTGIITTSRLIDRENDGGLQRLNVVAKDNGGLEGTVSVSVTIQNMNDMRPVFSQKSYSAAVDDNKGVGTSVISVKATDADSASLKYAIVIEDSNSIPFEINVNTGEITNNKLLDFDNGKTSYELCVKAFDDADPSLSEMTTVSINIVDVNDNNPVAEEDHITALLKPHLISEAAVPNTIVAVVHVTDADSGEFGRVTYSITGGNTGSVFDIRSATGEIYVKSSLDRELQSQYTLEISASDNGSPPLSIANTIKVTIEVKDVNDNSPSLKVEANLQVRQGQAQVDIANSEIESIDIDENDTPQLSLLNYNEEFEITNSNKIRTKEPLNANTVYEVVVQAIDKGGRITAKKTIISVDTENVSPSFDSQADFNITVPEDQPLNSILGVYIATDKDVGVGGDISYTFTGTNKEKFIYEEGILRLASPLDYESTNRLYQLTLTATDGEGKGTDQILKIHVSNVNDNAPVFNPSSYEVKLEESDSSVSISLDATDADGDALTYTIIENAISSLFQISNNVVSNVNPLPKNIDQYYFNVQVSDGAHVDIANVLIDVVNSTCSGAGGASGSIKMDTQIYTESVAENFDITVALVTVKATASGGAGSPVYSIEDPTSMFRVNPNSGEVFANATLDYEQNREYTVCVAAQGSVESSVKDSTTVKISVIDINDIPPIFAPGLKSFTVGTSQTGSPFTSVLANSPGSYPVLYSIEGGRRQRRSTTSDGIFGINNSTGAITLLKREAGDYDLVVTASSGIFEEKTNISVKVENDIAPSFPQEQYTTSLSEDAAIGTELSDVVMKADNVVSPQYVILGSSFFEIANTGIIKTKLGLDFETQAVHTFSVKVTDPSSSLIAVTTVQVSLINVDEEKPRFSGPFSAQITERFPTKLGLIHATVVEGANVNYTFKGDVDGYAIDETTAEVTLTKTQTIGVYELTILATNQYGSDEAVLTVDVKQGGFGSFSLVQRSLRDAQAMELTAQRKDVPEGGCSDVLITVGQDQPSEIVSYIQAMEEGGTYWSTSVCNSDSNSRKRRASDNEQLVFVVGKDSFCRAPHNPNIPCNMALKSNVEYLVTFRSVDKNGKISYTTATTKTQPLHKPPVTQATMGTTSEKNNLNYNYMIGLIVMGVLLIICIAAIALLLCKQRNQSTKDVADYPPQGVMKQKNNAYAHDEENQYHYQVGGPTSSSPSHEQAFTRQTSSFNPLPMDTETQEVNLAVDDIGSDQPPRPPSTNQPKLERTPSGRIILQHDFQ